MKLKIITLMILIISINNISCEVSESSEFESYGCISSNFYEDTLQSEQITAITGIKIQDIQIGDIDKIVSVITGSNWRGSTDVTSSWDLSINFYVDDTTYIGSGILGWNKDSSGDYHVIAFLQDTNISGLSGSKIITWSGYTGESMAIWGYCNQALPTNDDAAFVVWVPAFSRYDLIRHSDNTIIRDYHFINTYEYTKTNIYYLYEMNRTTAYTSKIKIQDNGGNILVNETSLKTLDYEYLSYDLNNYTWTITNENNYGDIEVDIIDFSLLIEDEFDENTPTLTTDKTTYNTSEQMTISFTNLDNIENDGNSPVYLRSIIIMYPDIDSYTGYGKKYIYNLLYHEYKGNFTINTSFLSPQTDYILFACDGMDKILFEGNSFNVYPDDEYLSISCDKDADCITYNGIKNTIYYKINNNSDIIIKDNDNNIINIYHNIIGIGNIIYTIPEDLNHLNTYPNWKVYLNNTEYSTSYNKNMEVYWSLFATPTPTPTPYPTTTPDINISDTIDEFKIETQPIKDLIFGLSEIVIDNPDYNKDNIIDENEINHWFNSLIPICIIFLLVILYIGLKKKRD